ncbi:MAG: hypothetical protein IPJ65_09180 [Archangiaceae bacterium]|nr:hypothetical protein [Archangiaceae bacterium]
MRRAALAFVLVLAACGGTRTTIIALGEPCDPTATPDNGRALCGSGLCVSLDNVSGFCSAECTEDSACGDGFVCQGAGRFGRICKKLSGCKLDSDCPAGHTCDDVTGNCYIKVSRGLCSPCQDVAQCPAGGSCFEALSSHEQFCTVPCGAGDACPIGFTCTSLPVAPGSTMTTRQCAPTSMSCNAGKPLCASCRGDAECGSPYDVCVRNVVSGEQFCGRDCNPKKNVCPGGTTCDPEQLNSAENPECPTGFSCTNIGQSDDPNVKGPYQCVPNSNTCVGYCDAANEADEARQCGLGRRCVNNKCTAANDGRMCTPCSTTDDCRRGAHAENRCIVNNCPSCPFRGESFCTTPCADDAACVRSFGVGFLCKDVSDTDGSMKKMCMPQRGSCAAGLGHLGDDCSKNGAQDCINGVCLVAGTQSLCSLACSHDAECNDARYQCCEVSAAGGYDCSSEKRGADGPQSGHGVCAPLGGLFGDDCTPGRPPCQTGTCLDLGTSQVCTVPCTGTTCPQGFECRKATAPGASTPIDVCFPNGGGNVGADCSFGPAACSSGYCIRKESGSVCTSACQDAASDCPAEWSCEPLATVDNMSVTACLPPELQ